MIAISTLLIWALMIVTGYLIIGFLVAYVVKFAMGKFEWINVLKWPLWPIQMILYKILS